jgi:hypothetical protein
MDEYSTARGWADAAMTQLHEDFDEARAAFRRVEAAHRQGDPAPALVAAFQARAEQVHLDAESAHGAHEAIRRALAQDATEAQHPR